MLFAATADRTAQLAYCQEHMLPIWEHWTDGNLVARHLLECESADPARSEERFQELLATTFQLRKRGRSARVAAALAAASVVCSAYIGVPGGQFKQTCRRAEEAGMLASRVAGWP
jgi:hypothetical protein